MQENDWVNCVHDNKFTFGFITRIANDVAEIQLVHHLTKSGEDLPDQSTIHAKISDCILQSNCIHPDDLLILLDLSLQIKDEEWFTEIMNELSLWRSPSEVMGRGD